MSGKTFMQTIFALFTLGALLMVLVFAQHTGMVVTNLWVLLACLTIYFSVLIVKAHQPALDNS